MMKMDALIPFNEQVIRTKLLKELGYTVKDINNLLNDGTLERTRKGYYKVTLNLESDINLMIYYLMNNFFDEFLEYFDSLTLKSYEAYYYRFMYDVMMGDFANAYKSLVKCCELNKKKENKLSLYAFVLLLNELMNLSNKKLATLKNKLFADKEDTLNNFLEFIIKRDYESACKSLRANKDSLSRLEVKVLRNLSIKAKEAYNKKNSPEMEEYNKIFNVFYECIVNNDYETGYYYFTKLYELSNKLGLNDVKLTIISDLFGCFNYIVEHPKITLETYQTKYKYNGDYIANFYQAINKNDYINAFKFVSEIIKKNNEIDFIIYHSLLERIYNFLNIRYVIKIRGSEQRGLSLNNLIKDKKYHEALDFATKSNMDIHDKNLVTSLLESLVALDDNSFFKQEN